MSDPAMYDSPAALEGPDNGLVEAVADRLWRKRSPYYRGRRSFTEQSAAVKVSWRETARDLLSFLFDLGFEGPGGRPKARGGLVYGWIYECKDWSVYDGDRGFVAMVPNDEDVPLFIQAPAMRDAIAALLERLGDDPASRMPEIEALAAALPKKDVP